jgi:hypothetical protein
MSEFLAIILFLCFRVRLHTSREMLSGIFYDRSALFWGLSGFMLKVIRSVLICLY